MDRIAQLDTHVVDQIAAGEVVERPASVVKELVENAFDAKALAVQVDLEDGGLRRITVSDDGIGMTPGDAEQAILRHTTSKLRSISDLECLQTLGFRGEALSSIAAVSRLTLSTREADASIGRRITLSGGALHESVDYGGPAGTSVDVRDLFFNVPARRKFVRSPATELAHAVEAALRVVLGNRRGGIVVSAGSRRLLDIPEDQSEPERVKAALGPRARELIPFSHTEDEITISGYVAPLEQTRGDTKAVWFFVNGRFVRDRMLRRALMEAFRPVLPVGCYPMLVLYLDTAVDGVDVNVHPQKLEVRFADSASVYRVSSAAFHRIVEQVGTSQRPVFSDSRAAVKDALDRFGGGGRQKPAMTLREGTYGDPGPTPSSTGHYRPAPLPGMSLETSPGGRLVGQRWAFRELSDSFVIVDLQGAAMQEAEEALFEACFPDGSVDADDLVLPELFSATSEGESYWLDLAPQLRRFGLEIDAMGPQRFALRARPAPLAGAPPAELIAVIREQRLTVPIDEAQMARLLRGLAATVAPPRSNSVREMLAQRWAQRDADNIAVFRLTDAELRQRLKADLH